MIPVPVLSSTFVILYLIGWVAIFVLVVWGAVLLLSPAARAGVAWNWRLGLMLGLLVTSGGFSALVTFDARRIVRRSDEEQQALRVTTTVPLRIQGISLPVGTRLITRQPGVPESFTDATFPAPTSVYGVRALEVRRSIPYTLGDSLPPATSAQVTLAADESVDGWRCSATRPVEFTLAESASVARLHSCTMAAGNLAGALPIPAGATLVASEGTVWSDGTQDRDRWVVMMEDSMPLMRLFGAELSGARLYLDGRREYLRLSDAELASALQLGAIRYPRGTRVSTAPPPLLARHPGALLFSPRQGQVVTAPGHRDVSFGYTLVQSPDGRVHGVFPNAEVGVLEFQRIEVDPR